MIWDVFDQNNNFVNRIVADEEFAKRYASENNYVLILAETVVDPYAEPTVEERIAAALEWQNVISTLQMMG